jgi:hypothetical protein
MLYDEKSHLARDEFGGPRALEPDVVHGPFVLSGEEPALLQVPDGVVHKSSSVEAGLWKEDRG